MLQLPAETVATVVFFLLLLPPQLGPATKFITAGSQTTEIGIKNL